MKNLHTYNWEKVRNDWEDNQTGVWRIAFKVYNFLDERIYLVIKRKKRECK